MRRKGRVMQEPQLTPELIAAHGLKPDEYASILQIIGREPTFTELGIFWKMVVTTTSNHFYSNL